MANGPTGAASQIHSDIPLNPIGAQIPLKAQPFAPIDVNKDIQSAYKTATEIDDFQEQQSVNLEKQQVRETKQRDIAILKSLQQSGNTLTSSEDLTLALHQVGDKISPDALQNLQSRLSNTKMTEAKFAEMASKYPADVLLDQASVSESLYEKFRPVVDEYKAGLKANDPQAMANYQAKVAANIQALQAQKNPINGQPLYPAEILDHIAKSDPDGTEAVLTRTKYGSELARQAAAAKLQETTLKNKSLDEERADKKEALAEKHEKAYESHNAQVESRMEQALADKKSGADAAKMGPEDFEFGAKQYLAGDKSVMTSLGYGKVGAENRAAMRRAIRTEATKAGLSPEDVATKMAEFGGLQAGERKLGERSANIGMAVTAASKFADLALEASNKVPRSDILPFNRILLAGEKGTGDENVVKFGAANNSFINAYARAVSPTGVPTVSDKDHAREILETAYSQGQYKAAIAQLQKEMKAEQASPAAVKQDLRDLASGKSSMGEKTAKSSVHTPSEIASAKAWIADPKNAKDPHFAAVKKIVEGG